MTGAQLATIRQQLGLSLVEMGRALGYEGNRNTVQVAVSRYEAGDRPIPPWIANLVWAYYVLHRHGLLDEALKCRN